MSVSTCVRCDNDACTSQLHHDPMQRPHEWHLPDTWFTLVRGDVQVHTTQHFCSVHCLARWVSLQPKEIEVRA